MQQGRDYPQAPGAAAFLQRRAARSAALVEGLTGRQRDVLGGMVDGLLNKQIAARLGINEKTVKMHRAALFERLGVGNSAGAVRIGVEAAFGLALWAPEAEDAALVDEARRAS